MAIKTKTHDMVATYCAIRKFGWNLGEFLRRCNGSVLQILNRDFQVTAGATNDPGWDWVIHTSDVQWPDILGLFKIPW